MCDRAFGALINVSGVKRTRLNISSGIVLIKYRHVKGPRPITYIHLNGVTG